MGAKILKFLVIGYFALGVQSASAQSSVYEVLMPGSCPHMSKDPRCWEALRPQRSICPDKEWCTVIRSVRQDSVGKFHCKDFNGYGFSCDKIVEQFGSQLEGEVVKVVATYVDRCHIPGGCGAGACITSYRAASFDQLCE